MKFYRLSKIERKATRAIVISALIGFLAVLAAAYEFYMPALYEKAKTLYITSANEVQEEIDVTYKKINDYTLYIQNSASLMSAIDKYGSSKNISDLYECMDEYTKITDSIRAIILILPDGTTAVYDSQRDNSALGSKDTDYIESIKQYPSAQKEYMYYYTTNTNIPTAAVTDVTEDFSLTVMYNASKMMYTVEIHADTYFSGLSIYNCDNGGTALMYDHGNTASCGNILNSYASQTVQDNFIDASDGYYLLNNVPSINWKIITFINKETFNENIMPPFWSAILLCCLLCIMMVVITCFFINRLVAPIDMLKKHMHEAANGNLDAHADIVSNDEIGGLVQSFNFMLHDLKININKRIESEQREQRMKYNLLASQINHHFIHNTISVVNALIRNNMLSEALLANRLLAKILSNCLKIQDADMFNSVRREIDIVNAYWGIEKLRKTNHTVLKYDIDDGAYDILIPKNIIQPLIENSLLHGLTDHETGECIGNIIISIKVNGSELLIDAEDDGSGFTAEALDSVIRSVYEDDAETGKHISLINIRKRLFYLYGRECMEILSCGHTNVILKIPL